MTELLVVALALVALVALVAVVLLLDYATTDVDDDRTRIDSEVRRAERRLHEIARHSFEAMLAEARSNEHRT